ncbi:hypothetical protein PRN20_12410 [Devosia sp. ZB163]|uniref:hypothetical protein n=1 Tax=Devosia sp. ZB163 TaxID=3025938 RepID=UPI002362F779|nr:hypothetical protein [Devosia sp. ZB163]MDC9824538.1 hypothetical protein [Devosia sp. ZB163]
MKKTIAISLIALSLVAFPAATPTLAVDTGITSLCGPDGPENYKAQGGFCDQVGANGSLVESGDCTEAPWIVESSFGTRVADEKLLVAASGCYDYPELPDVV